MRTLATAMGLVVIAGCGGGDANGGAKTVEAARGDAAAPAVPPDAAAASTAPVDATDAGVAMADAAVTPAGDAGSSATSSLAAIGVDDAGKTVTRRIGAPLVIALKGNPTTGFAWVVASVDKALGQPKSEFVSDGNGGNAVGVGGKQTFTWSTSAPGVDLHGKHVVELEYKRGFEKGVKPARTFKVTIDLTD